MSRDLSCLQGTRSRCQPIENKHALFTSGEACGEDPDSPARIRFPPWRNVKTLFHGSGPTPRIRVREKFHTPFPGKDGWKSAQNRDRKNRGETMRAMGSADWSHQFRKIALLSPDVIFQGGSRGYLVTNSGIREEEREREGESAREEGGKKEKMEWRAEVVGPSAKRNLIGGTNRPNSMTRYAASKNHRSRYSAAIMGNRGCVLFGRTIARDL